VTVDAVVVLLLWFWISAFVVLLGAELDAEIERRSMTNADAAT
jgi:membrane protein